MDTAVSGEQRTRRRFNWRKVFIGTTPPMHWDGNLSEAEKQDLIDGIMTTIGGQK